LSGVDVNVRDGEGQEDDIVRVTEDVREVMLGALEEISSPHVVKHERTRQWIAAVWQALPSVYLDLLDHVATKHGYFGQNAVTVDHHF